MPSMKLLLLTPPMVQINTPYPATAYLKGFLRERHPEVAVSQADIGLELFLKLFSQITGEKLRNDSEHQKKQKKGKKHDAITDDGKAYMFPADY